MGVPYEIVRAIVTVESDGNPYVLNVAIGSVWQVYRFDHAETAQVFLREALKLTDRIDIGLMQVHWAVWKKVYSIDATALLDVSTNLRIGCDILRRELAGDGPLWMRIGRYHSRTPALNQRYASQVLHAALRP
jgi:soluble lytic murein transglycosylase-like protein